MSVTGLLTGTSSQRSSTGLILQPLRSLSMFTQTANWWHQLAMLTSSRCLLWTMKMSLPACCVRMDRARPEAPSRSFRREARGASRGSAPQRASSNPGQVKSQHLPVPCHSEHSGRHCDGHCHSSLPVGHRVQVTLAHAGFKL